MRAHRCKTYRGFTLIELLVALTLLALLATVAMPLADLVKRRASEAELRHALLTIRSALDAYKRAAEAGQIELSPDQSGYPPNLRALVEGVADKKSLKNRHLYFLRKIPIDPMSVDQGGSAEETWETRSYESDAESFSSGEDVFDIRSSSQMEGMNGIPYNQW